MDLRVSSRIALLPLIFSAACEPTVGTQCDEDLARTVVYSASGRPAYAGQSMFITSCAGGGSFCHADSAMNRYGAPHGMNFDVILADEARFAGDERAGAAHLYATQLLTHDLRDSIYGQVVSGEMPPGNAGTVTMAQAYIQYASATDTTGTPVPAVTTAEGREILRNWLACGSPVIEATTDPTPVPCTTDSECMQRRQCDATRSECVNVGAVEPTRSSSTPTPTWSYLYPAILQPSCATSVCHGTAGTVASGNLDLSTSATAHAAMVGVMANSAACGTRIVAGNPDTSFLIQKLDGTQSTATCGQRMPVGVPLSAEQIALFRTWIMNGALMD